jgi:hypothetical protein
MTIKRKCIISAANPDSSPFLGRKRGYFSGSKTADLTLLSRILRISR